MTIENIFLFRNIKFYLAIFPGYSSEQI